MSQFNVFILDEEGMHNKTYEQTHKEEERMGNRENPEASKVGGKDFRVIHRGTNKLFSKQKRIRAQTKCSASSKHVIA